MRSPPTHMHEIRPKLWLGSKEAESCRLVELQNRGITHIVQTGTGPMLEPTHRGYLQYCCIDVKDAEGEDLLLKLQAAKAFEFINKGLQLGGAVLVHCFAGVSRSATTVIAYLMEKESLNFEEAMEEVMKQRFMIAPNRGFCKQLRLLEKECGGRLADYKPVMLQGAKDYSWGEWMALLARVRNRARPTLPALPRQSDDPESPLPLNHL